MSRGAAQLEDAVAAATAARVALARPVEDVARALAEAAVRWRATPDLATRLAESTGCAAPMLEDMLDAVVAPFDATAMTRLARRERAGAPAPPPVVAHVLASNVPALALPAIAHALLAGAAVVVKSGRDDRTSAPAFREALAGVDAALAATIVTTTWPRGAEGCDAALLASAPLVVLTGSDAALAALASQARARVLAFGTRTSVAVVAEQTDETLAALARDVACWEQRGCLSPHVAFVAGDLERAAAGLAVALERLAERWPPASADLDTRAARRALLEDARWAGAAVREGAWGAVVAEPEGSIDGGPGGRTIRLRPLGDLTTLSRRLPAGTIECVGSTGPVPPGLDALGVARVCALGAMQRPSLAWPRGRRPPVRMLLDPDARAAMEDDR